MTEALGANEPSVTTVVSDFVHLHVHSEYSFLDGSIRIKELVKEVKARGHSHVALTDHGNLHGAIELYTTAKAHDLTPILGCEVYHQGSDEVRALEKEAGVEENQRAAFHLVILARDRQGYQDLLKVVSQGYSHGNLKDIPVVSEQSLDTYGQAMVALSGCLRGEFGFLVKLLRQISGKGPLLLEPAHPQAGPIYQALAKHTARMEERFGRGNYYVELIDNQLPQQKMLLPDLITTARHFGLPCVATADAHYLHADFADTHALAIAIKNSLTLSDIRGRLRMAQFHLRSDAEMRALFHYCPEALSNTAEIARKCSGLHIPMDTYFLPKIDLGTAETPVEALQRLAKEGLEERFSVLATLYGEGFDSEKRKLYWERLEHELKVIIQMGFPDYFLIVQDFINWAKRQAIPVGPGRGSGAGSLVAYALRITDLDPIPYNLIFERFLNPERVSMPDFDVDFCQWRREEVIQYCVQKYGSSNVAQITTFGKMQAKAAVKSVGRAMNLGYSRVDQFTKLFPPDLGITLKDALAQEPRLSEEMEKDEALKECMTFALRLEGLVSHTSVHAAGLVISDGEMTDYIPVYTTDGHSYITQYEMKPTEKVGLVKFDFLGLKTLTVIDKAVQIIRQGVASAFDIAKIRLDDPAVYHMLSQGRTVGIFQCESGGMTQLITKLKPSTFEDIIALVALFRPGPLGSGMVDDFVERKHGRQKIVYPHPLLEPILKDTYGMILYQEQVQKIAAVLANYSLGEADLLRRAMGKKNPEEMAKQKSRFISGAVGNSIDEKLAEEIFDLMAEFAKYGFNKSHSAAYGLVSYQTAYLKAHYPEQFFAAIMTCDGDNTEKIVRYADDCIRSGFAIWPPDINRSVLTFDVPQKGCVGFSLAAIKGLGEGVLKPLIAEREKNGPYKSLYDLAHRLDLGKLGKKNLQLLIAAGALDGFGYRRRELEPLVEDMVAYSQKHHEAHSLGQRSLFALLDADEGLASVQSQVGAPWEGKLTQAARCWEQADLFQEKKLLGIFIAGHPLDFLQADGASFAASSLLGLKDFAVPVEQRLYGQGGKGAKGAAKVAVVALLSSLRFRRTKRGTLMAYARLEEKACALEAMIFEEQIKRAKLPAENTPVLAIGSVELGDGGQLMFSLDSLRAIEEVRCERVRALMIVLHRPEKIAFFQDWCAALKDSLLAWQGSVPVKVQIHFPHTQLLLDTSHIKVALSDGFINQISPLLLEAGALSYVI